jgi:hypothetical protein
VLDSKKGSSQVRGHFLGVSDGLGSSCSTTELHPPEER